MKALVNLEFPSFAPRHRLIKLISALGLASVATVARYESATCDEENFSSPEECASALIHTRFACAGFRGGAIALREKNSLNSVLSVDNYVIFTCCARVGNKINAMVLISLFPSHGVFSLSPTDGHELTRIFARAALVLGLRGGAIALREKNSLNSRLHSVD